VKYSKAFWQLRCALLKRARTSRSSSLRVTSVTFEIANRPIVLINDEVHLLKHPVFLWKDYTSLVEFHEHHLENSGIWDLKCFDLYSQIREVRFQSFSKFWSSRTEKPVEELDGGRVLHVKGLGKKIAGF